MADIFISYTHRDNAKLSDEQHGWVDRFHEALEIRLTTLWGRQAEIWRDFKTQGNDALTPTIKTTVEHSSILISVLSPGYVHSEWCSRELDLFCQAARKSGGLVMGTQSRIIKVIKTPVERSANYNELVDLIGYPFYQLDERGTPCEFDARLGETSRQQFLAKVNELAYDVCSMLERLTGKSSGRECVAPPSGAVLYLAETTSDLAPFCDQVRRELEQSGHVVLPRGNIGHTADYVERAKENLRRAAVSVHPIGKSYGIVPEGHDRSILELQYDAAGDECGRRPDLVRLPWMLPANAVSDERLVAFIARLQDDPRFLITSLDNLKTTVGDILSVKTSSVAVEPRRAAVPTAAREHAAIVYLVADPCDSVSVQACEDVLFAGGCEVMRALYEGAESELRIDHLENLRSADAILIYHGQTTQFWLRSKLRDLQKAFGYGREAPFSAAAVLLGPPPRPDKEQFRSNEVLVLKALDGFEPAVMQPFIERVTGVRSEVS